MAASLRSFADVMYPSVASNVEREFLLTSNVAVKNENILAKIMFSTCGTDSMLAKKN
jgi:hypothetical protein